jgi:uncharacterized membrane protein YgcG
MTRRPFRQGDADGLGADLEPTVADMDRYLADSESEPSRGFADRVMHAVESEPIPRRGVMAFLAATFSSERGRVALIAATVAVAIMAVVATGQLARVLPQFGGSPQPSQSAPASQEPSPPITPSPSVSPSESASPSAGGSDDESGSPDGSDSPDESDDADVSPSATDDNSGPGGGDDGVSSGPGSGDDGSSSGPGGSSSSPEAAD